jgi:hypothetical protein
MNRKLDAEYTAKRPKKKLQGELKSIEPKEIPDIKDAPLPKRSHDVSVGKGAKMNKVTKEPTMKYSKTGSLTEQKLEELRLPIEQRIDEIEDEIDDPSTPSYRIEELIEELEGLAQQMNDSISLTESDHTITATNLAKAGQSVDEIAEYLIDSGYDEEQAFIQAEHAYETIHDTSLIETTYKTIDDIERSLREEFNRDPVVEYVLDHVDEIEDKEGIFLDEFLDEASPSDVADLAIKYGYSDSQEPNLEVLERAEELLQKGIDADEAVLTLANEFGIARDEALVYVEQSF